MTADTSLVQRRLAALQMAYGVEIPDADVALAEVALVTEAIDRAALAGPFDLYRLTAFVHPEDRDAVRTQVAVASEPAPTGDRRLRWLKPERRRDALGPMLDNPAGLPALLGRVRLDRADHAGRAMRDLLRGWRPDLRRITTGRLAALITALGWLEGLTPPPGPTPLPDVRDTRMELSRRERKSSRDALLSDGFVGRRKELAAIRKLIDEPGQEQEVLILTGPGGIGKSALLARAARTMGNRDPKVPVFLFDFDRPSLDPLGPGLTMEFSRQLAAMLPEAASELSSLRSLMRETFLQGGGEGPDQSTSLESALRSTSEAGYMIGGIVRRHGLNARPVLVLFDTLEVVAAQGSASLGALAEWVHFARYGLGLGQMRVAIAGRAAEVSAGSFGTVTEYAVPPLPRDDAVRLLTLMGVDVTRAGAAAETLGGNPLVLRLGGEFLIDHPEATAADLHEGGAADSTLSQGVLYHRILNHVGEGPSDPLRKLAYPGLALRLVTPGLIEKVVAPALGITLADTNEASRLWDRLVEQIWLVELEADGRARHRRDLRTLMVQQMRRDSAAAPLVRKLHQLALVYHRRAADPDIPADRARLEAVYHALMLLPPGRELSAAEAKLVAASLGGEYSDLPPHSAALARDCAGAPPQFQDIALVPASRRDAVTAQLGWAAVDGDRPFEALALAADDYDPWCWRLTAWLMAADWNNETVNRGVAMLEPQVADDWWSEHKTRLDGMRVAAVEQREQREHIAAAAAWLRLARGDSDRTESDTQDGEAFLRSVPGRIAVLRSAAARSLMRMSTGEAPKITRYTLSLITLLSNKSRSKEPLLADEIARLELLLWDTTSDTQIRFRPASIVVTPNCLKRYRELVANRPAVQERIERLLKEFPHNATVAQLTGKLALDVAEWANNSDFSREQFKAAGFRPLDLIHGLMHEFRPGARVLLRRVVAWPNATAALADQLPALLRFDDSSFLPADLHPEAWRAAAGRSDGSRAVAALVDWAGRTGCLGKVLDAAGPLASDEGDTARLSRFAAAVRIVDRALGQP